MSGRTAHRLALVGHGRMGRLVEELAPGHGFEVALRLAGAANPDGAGITAESFRGIDVAIDFSAAAAVPANAERTAALGVPLVVGTTGWAPSFPGCARRSSGMTGGSSTAPTSRSASRSSTAWPATAARLLSEQTAYDAWAYEIHHNKKKDAPSGTLLELKRTMEGAGWDRPIDVASNRAGAIPGTHQIGFDSEADTILLEHRARDRSGFAHGALRAARWMIGRRGIYEFSQVWEEIAHEPL